MNQLTLISYILNGINFASYELDSFRYRAEPIEDRQQIMIPSLIKSQVTRIDLIGVLNFPLLVTGIDVDVADDDERNLDEGNSQNNKTSQFDIYVSVVNRKTNKVVKKLTFVITSYPTYTNEIIFNPDYIYEIKASKTINLITFTGKPVYLRQPIVFTDGVVQEKNRD